MGGRAFVTLVAAVLSWTALAGAAGAASFTSVEDFEGTGTDDGRTYVRISDAGQRGYVGSYDHVVTFEPAAVKVTSASVTVDYRKVSENTTAELWFFYSGSAPTKIGELDGIQGNGTNWQSQTFDLAPALYGGVEGATWTLAFTFKEMTRGQDEFDLDKSVLAGTYTPVEAAPVPIPASALLLATGLAGLGLIGRRKQG